jgi:cellulose biosynthesis protein BcsQ
MPGIAAVAGKVICLANLKGGVGKTLAAKMVSESLAAQGQSVLMVDTDPQGNLGYSFVGKDGLVKLRQNGTTIQSYVSNRLLYEAKAQVGDVIHRNVSKTYLTGKGKASKTKIDLIACTPDLMDLERRVILEMGAKGQGYDVVEREVMAVFAEVLAHGRKSYDWVVVDSAPGMNLLTRSALSLADGVVIPTVPEELPLFGLSTFLAVVFRPKEHNSAFPKPVRPLVLVSRFRKTSKDHAEQVDMLRTDKHAGKAYEVLDTMIPEVPQFFKPAFFEQILRSFTAHYTSAQAKLALSLATEIQGKVHARKA